MVSKQDRARLPAEIFGVGDAVWDIGKRAPYLGTIARDAAFSSRAPLLMTFAQEHSQMDHTMHSQLMADEFDEDTLIDATLYGPDDETIGTVGHVHGSGSAAQIVVDVGGFLGMGTKPVLLSASDVTFMRDEDGNVHATTNFTKDQMKAMPEHNE